MHIDHFISNFYFLFLFIIILFNPGNNSNYSNRNSKEIKLNLKTTPNKFQTKHVGLYAGFSTILFKKNTVTFILANYFLNFLLSYLIKQNFW